MVAFCILLKELCRQLWGSDVVIWAPGVAVEVSLLVGKPLLGAACGVSNIPQMAVCFNSRPSPLSQNSFQPCAE